MIHLSDKERTQLNAVRVKESGYRVMTVLEVINTTVLLLLFFTPLHIPRLEYGTAVSTVVLLSIKLYLTFELFLKLKRVSYAFEHVRAFDTLVANKCSSYFPFWGKIIKTFFYHLLLGALFFACGQSKVNIFLATSCIMTFMFDISIHYNAKKLLMKLDT